MEATSDLASGHWVRLCTTNLTEIALPLNDPDGGLYRSRFYRVVGP